MSADLSKRLIPADSGSWLPRYCRRSRLDRKVAGPLRVTSGLCSPVHTVKRRCAVAEDVPNVGGRCRQAQPLVSTYSAADKKLANLAT
ncbi:hypothetical protein [Streptomyces sp. NPDC127084]|uniref:hypothetical protein n=1 Tax=Streptomyces sp. NPDC127084 TaxID=3347133 RepID=UPI00364BC31D